MAVTAATTGCAAINAKRLLTTPLIFPMIEITLPRAVPMVPIAVITLPITISTGPTTAAIPAIVRIVFLVPSSNSLKALTTSVIFFTISVKAGIKNSLRFVKRTLIAELNIVRAPCALSVITPYISSVAPLELYMASVSLS